jgi:hypothetical protein
VSSEKGRKPPLVLSASYCCSASARTWLSGVDRLLSRLTKEAGVWALFSSIFGGLATTEQEE